MKRILVPQLNPNEDQVLLVEWLKTDGDMVHEGDVIALAETSKAEIEIEAEASGYLRTVVAANAHATVGHIMALLLDTADEEVDPAELSTGSREPEPAGSTGLTLGAQLAARRLGIDRDTLDRSSIRTVDEINAYASAVEPPAPGSSIVIVGGGGFARMCIEAIWSQGGYEIAGIVDPALSTEDTVLGVPVIGKDEDLPALGQSGVSYACNAIGAIADPTARAKIFRMLKQEGFTLPNLIHGSAVVSDSVVLGEGNLVMAGAIVGPSAVLGDGCVVNTGAVVSHDCRLGNHVHIAPGALLAGGVSVGDLSLIGMGCTIYLGLHIGRGVTIYNGQHIFGNLADGAVVK